MVSQPAESKITVEVVYALADEQALLSVQVPADATAEQAIESSGLLARFPEIDLAKNKLAIWYRSARKDAALKAGDRVMVLRPLIADPKEIRRRRAEEAKQEGRADKVTGGRPVRERPVRRRRDEPVQAAKSEQTEQPAQAESSENKDQK